MQPEIDRRIKEIAEYDAQIAIFERAVELGKKSPPEHLPDDWVTHLEKLLLDNRREKAKSELMLATLKSM